MRSDATRFLLAGVALCSLPAPGFSRAGERTAMVPRLPEPEVREIWEWKTLRIAPAPPDFTGSILLRDASTLAAKLATPIVLAGNGSASAAVVSPEGWIVTNYHAVMSRVQQSAVEGVSPATAELIFCRVRDGRVERVPGTRTATVYRIDPVKDLALLKLDDLAENEVLPHLNLNPELPGDRIRCFAVGSPGPGIPWSVRDGGVAGTGDYPRSLTRMVQDPSRAAEFLADRTRVEIIVTDCAITDGDSGGPLLDDYGDLIGINFAVSADRTQAFHISAREVQDFLDELPSEPEPAPFDVWIAGLPGGNSKAPFLAVMGERLQMLKYTHHPSGSDGDLVAEVAFFDCRGRNEMSPGGADSVLGLVPRGLWGMGGEGRFAFDVCMVRRDDGTFVTGYVGEDGAVDLLRVDRDADGRADVVWSRQGGTWRVAQASGRDPVIEGGRCCPEAAAILESVRAGG